MTSRISAAAAAALLAACSSDGSTERTSRAVYESATAVFRPAPEIIAPTDRPYVVIGYEGVRTPMALAGRREGFERYEGVGGVEMTLQNGFLVRLRGLGRELEAIYLAENGSSPDLAARARRGESLERQVDYWEKGAPRREVFLCALSAADAADNRTNVTEKCRSIYGDEQFVNLYILNSDGGLVISQQWFHPEADAIIIEHELN